MSIEEVRAPLFGGIRHGERHGRDRAGRPSPTDHNNPTGARVWQHVFLARPSLAAGLGMYIGPLTISWRFIVRLLSPRLIGGICGATPRPFRVDHVRQIALATAIVESPVFLCPHRQRLSNDQAASVELQMTPPFRYVPGQTLRRYIYRLG